jgi:hypothetical protein
MLTPFGRVISRIAAQTDPRLRRNYALDFWTSSKAEPEKLPFRGRATALFVSSTLSLNFYAINCVMLSITRCPARSLRT